MIEVDVSTEEFSPTAIYDNGSIVESSNEELLDWDDNLDLDDFELDSGIVSEGIPLEKQLDSIDYSTMFDGYVPSEFALKFVSFIKLVNGKEGEENKTPVIHMDMLDTVVDQDDNMFVSFRGSAKTSVLHEYMFLYIATYGEVDNFGSVDVAIYVSDTIDNGVKSMRQNLEFRYKNSEFLQKFVPYAKFTDVRWEFKNASEKYLCVRGFGANTGVRGFKEYGKRPTWCSYDDLMSDKNAESPTIIRDIEKVVYKASRQAMHPKKRKFLWTGTPFNKKDPLYKGASSGAWNVKVYPICDKFPVKRADFYGAWEDRFDYDFILKEYLKLKKNAQLPSFYQELMLRVISEEERLVDDDDVRWFSRSSVVKNREKYNFYITTDFATSSNARSDFSVILVWAYNSSKQWMLVDGVCRRQLMDANVDDLFRMASIYRPLDTGIEITGQQGGFVSWIQKEMLDRNIYFKLAKDKNSNKVGIRPTTNKMQRFNVILPMFKQGDIWIAEDLPKELLNELEEELRYASAGGFQSAHDDVIDAISMIGSLKPIKPAFEQDFKFDAIENSFVFDDYDEEKSHVNSYLF